MENVSFFEKIASQLSQSASVKNVYGTPITVGEKTIIPVSRTAYGFGGGFGQGHKMKKGASVNMKVEDQEKPGANGEEGAGGGGGMYVQPKGVYEVTNNATRFIPVHSTRQLVLGICVGFLLCALMSSRHS